MLQIDEGKVYKFYQLRFYIGKTSYMNMNKNGYTAVTAGEGTA